MDFIPVNITFPIKQICPQKAIISAACIIMVKGLYNLIILPEKFKDHAKVR